MAFSFKDYIIELLPPYFKRWDNYKDNQGEGLFQRYTQVFEEELDNEILPPIRNLHFQLNPLKTEPKFLKYIAHIFGYPPYIFSTQQNYRSSEDYRRFLAHIMEVIKNKGNIKSYKALFNLLGFDIQIIEWGTDCYLYDNGHNYDSGNLSAKEGIGYMEINSTFVVGKGTNDPNKGFILYDFCCNDCTEYSIVYRNLGQPCLPDPNVSNSEMFNEVSDEILENFKAIICYIEPINARVREIIPGEIFCDSFNSIDDESLVINKEDYLLYDDSHLYDNNRTYDEVISSSTNVII